MDGVTQQISSCFSLRSSVDFMYLKVYPLATFGILSSSGMIVGIIKPVAKCRV